MDTGKAIFFGLALIALTIFAMDAIRPANAGLMGSGKYMGVNGTGVLWIVDTESGNVRTCHSLDYKCRPWIK